MRKKLLIGNIAFCIFIFPIATIAEIITIDASWLIAGETDWKVSSGKIECLGTKNNQSIQKNITVFNDRYYKLNFEVLNYFSGKLSMSRWGLVGPDGGYEITKNWQSGAAGKFNTYLICKDSTKPLRITSDMWKGSLSDKFEMTDITYNPPADNLPIEKYPSNSNIKSATVSWEHDGVGNPIGFMLFFGNENEWPKYRKKILGGMKWTSIDYEYLPPGIRWKFAVTAFNVAGESEISSPGFYERPINEDAAISIPTNIIIKIGGSE